MSVTLSRDIITLILYDYMKMPIDKKAIIPPIVFTQIGDIFFKFLMKVGNALMYHDPE